ncbi:hypothetical protein [Erwinia phage FBB1]|nr:hypothetical protein [Erwinia phage FBB1]
MNLINNLILDAQEALLYFGPEWPAMYLIVTGLA